MEPDALVRDYLGRLEAAAWPLGADRRTELMAEVGEHIETALAEAQRRDEVTTRNVLERLGAPEEIVAAEMGGDREGETAAPVRILVERRRGWGAMEIAAIGFLTLGAVVLPFIGPLIGLLFVWGSSQWTTSQKWIATAIVAVLFVLPILLLLGVSGGTGPVTSTIQEVSQ
jgi:uncharacterized membrane protein